MAEGCTVDFRGVMVGLLRRQFAKGRNKPACCVPLAWHCKPDHNNICVFDDSLRVRIALTIAPLAVST
jgi:hypothetical protein